MHVFRPELKLNSCQVGVDEVDATYLLTNANNEAMVALLLRRRRRRNLAYFVLLLSALIVLIVGLLICFRFYNLYYQQVRLVSKKLEASKLLADSSNKAGYECSTIT